MGSAGKRDGTLEGVIAVAMKGMFQVDETIKPVVSYLAANLHERTSPSICPCPSPTVLTILAHGSNRRSCGSISCLCCFPYLARPYA